MAHPIHQPLDVILSTLDFDELVGLAQSLVQIPSVSGREGLAISQFMVDWLRRHGVEADLQEISPERANVFARVEGNRPGPRLLLNGHLDTKPGDTMTIAPYSGEVRDGRLWGRGSCDMKGPVAAMMVATAALAQHKDLFSGTLLFGSEVGEDGGGWKFEELVAGPCQCDLGICGEPTNLAVHVGCRGSFPLKIRTLGLATHTGTAYEGINAIQKMCSVIPVLYALPCFHQEDPIWGRPPINAMIIRGGGKVSASVPDECEVQFDIRLNPTLPPERLAGLVDATLANLQQADPELKLEVLTDWKANGRHYHSLPASEISPTHPLVTTVVDALTPILGQRPKLAGFPGGCSASIMLRRGIPALIFGPGDLHQAHSVDEWLDLEQLRIGCRGYVAIALRLLSVPTFAGSEPA
ncbi:MAG TPA: M20/M25/M40 family metallo-hydrolase [Chloroflexota bacterium]|nr:M20/M25/M40 family metallo-hydrolase [Chloroflexota bacterium]